MGLKFKIWGKPRSDQEKAIAFLKTLDLKQEPPRRRTVLCVDGPVSVNFPWVSIGTYGDSVYAFYHRRAWKTPEDALDIFYNFPWHSSSAGRICTGAANTSDPRAAFWMTGFDCASEYFEKILKYNTDRPSLHRLATERRRALIASFVVAGVVVAMISLVILFFVTAWKIRTG